MENVLGLKDWALQHDVDLMATSDKEGPGNGPCASQRFIDCFGKTTSLALALFCTAAVVHAHGDGVAIPARGGPRPQLLPGNSLARIVCIV